MRYWTYSKKGELVQVDPYANVVRTWEQITERLVDRIPKQLGSARVSWHWTPAPKTYDMAAEIGVETRKLCGVVQADVTIPRNHGQGVCERLVDMIHTFLNGTMAEHIIFGSPTVEEGHEFKEDLWRVQVSCPWNIEVIKRTVSTS